jgi:hypothetical protein
MGVCMYEIYGYVCVHAPLALERLDGLRSCSVFKSLAVIDWYLVNVNTSDSGTGTFQISPETQNADFI